jgi:hypothetical protein
VGYLDLKPHLADAEKGEVEPGKHRRLRNAKDDAEPDGYIGHVISWQYGT